MSIKTQEITLDLLWQALNEVPDPEIPVVSLVEMGIVRGVEVEEGRVVVTLTPTFAGCPALEVMGGDIQARLRQLGILDVEITWTYDPPWTSDWIIPEAREKMKRIGLAPPRLHGGEFIPLLIEQTACPYCGSEDTSLRNSFGSTPCRMIYTCNNCKQPFERFKPI